MQRLTLMSLSNKHIPILGFAAYSGSGKTTLLEKLIPVLSNLGIRTSVIKHSHHDFEIDYPGKDSYRLRKAGTQQLLIASPHRQALITENRDSAHQPPKEPELASLIEQLNPHLVDMILVEGFRHNTSIPKIEIHRHSTDKPYIFPEDTSIIALATDNFPIIGRNFSTHPPLLPLNEPVTIARFIKDFLGL
jgi:molybdopterin-guanine dinucleotide biosynthesis protein MobB